MEDKKLIEKQIKADKELPIVLKGLTIKECNDSNLVSVKYAKVQDTPVSYNQIEMNYYKPISKCYKHK